MNKHALNRLLSVLALTLLVGCANTQNVAERPRPDTVEDVNRVFYNVNDTLDRHIMRPISENYADAMPKPVRGSVTHFFDNLGSANTALHSLLQGKFNRSFSDVSRFMINSTVGIGGLFDVASSMGFQRSQEDVGQTLAGWGVGQGPYLYLPLFGPNTARNSPDLVSSYFTNPLSYLSGAFLFPVTALGLINTRANLLEASRFVEEAAIDPYSFTREAYLQQRRNLIHDGNPPLPDNYDDLFDSDPDGPDDSEPALIID